MDIFKILLVIHVACGLLSLLLGFYILLAKKGNESHKKTGLVYFYAMLINSIVAIPMSVMHPNYFLFLISIFTLYMLLTGVRYLKKSKVTDVQITDWILTIVMLLFGVTFVGLGIFNMIKSNYFGSVFIVFGSIGLLFSYQDYLNFKGKSTIKNYFLTTHIQRMTGSYIASSTAALVVNNTLLPNILAWLLPTIVFVPLIQVWTRKYMKKNILVCFILSIQGIGYSQQIPATFGKILTKQEATYDYKLLYESLTNYHPSPYKYNAEADFKTFFDKQKLTISDTISELEFHYLCRILIAQVKCGHTFARPSNAWYAAIKDKNVQLPFDVKYIDKRLYINNTIDEAFDFVPGDELLSINQVSISDLFEKMSSMQEKDGLTQSFSHALIEKRFRTYLLFILGVQGEYLVGYKNNAGEVKQKMVLATNKKLKENKSMELLPYFTPISSNNWSTFNFDSSQNVAYLKISSFSDRKQFRAYYKSVFLFLQGKPDSKLIVDIRDNPGGDFRHGNNFLTYVTPNKFELTFEKSTKKKPKNEYLRLNKWSKWTKIGFSMKPSKYKAKGKSIKTFTYKPNKLLFKGKVYAITNGITFSQAALVAAQLKENGAMFFGQETGGTEVGCNGLLNYELVLPNSEILVTIPVYHVKSNSSKGEFGYGIKPNYFVPSVIGNTKDYTLEEVMKIIKNN